MSDLAATAPHRKTGKPTRTALLGIGLLLIGALCVFLTSRRYREQHLVANAGSCRLDVTLVELARQPTDADTGAVVLFHGLSANKGIMQYLARAFAEQGLRVYVPDLPGHGRSAGPFSPAGAESCALSFVRGLSARGLIRPERTILAGHSMGAAIALRVAGPFRPAGVIAVSPAPMVPAHGVSPELLLFHNPPAVPPGSLIAVGQFEPEWLRENAKDFMARSTDGSSQYAQIPFATHVSVLFSPTVARLSQEWAARQLSLPLATVLPSRLGYLGGLFGVLGVLLIAGPFLRESIGEGKHPPMAAVTTPPPAPARRLVPLRILSEFAVVALATVFILRYWIPLRAIGLFEGDYLASFFLFAGLLLVLLHLKTARAEFRSKGGLLLGAAFAALVLHLLLSGWVQLTLTETWLTLERWSRFPLFFLSSFVFLYAIEIVLGPVQREQSRRRFLLGFALVAIAWLAMVFGVAVLHDGEILLVLLSVYFGLLFLLLGLGAQLVRRVSGSATAAAVFGAIILTGFCLVLFPVS